MEELAVQREEQKVLIEQQKEIIHDLKQHQKEAHQDKVGLTLSFFIIKLG